MRNTTSYILFHVDEGTVIPVHIFLFAFILVVITLLTGLVPILALLTVPTYLAILFAFGAERVSFSSTKSVLPLGTDQDE